jgi:hypothetical protein
MEVGFRQFVEALEQFRYTLPKDKEQQIYDFYIVNALAARAETDPLMDEGIKHATANSRRTTSKISSSNKKDLNSCGSVVPSMIHNSKKIA